MFPEWLKRDGGFPVKITGYNATTHAHDWTLQIIEPDGSMTADTRTISGGSLFELNDQQVATDSYIFARWAGLDESGMSVFMCAKGSGSTAASLDRLLKVTGTSTGNGMYVGKTATAITSSGGIASITWAAADDCLIQNLMTDVHDLKVDGTHITKGQFMCMTTEGTPRPLYAIRDFREGCG
jgi:hypothetical protein